MLFDLAPGCTGADSTVVLALLLGGAELCLLYRGGELFVPRLRQTGVLFVVLSSRVDRPSSGGVKGFFNKLMRK